MFHYFLFPTFFSQACENGRGAILLSVARGKVSEGIDFGNATSCRLLFESVLSQRFSLFLSSHYLIFRGNSHPFYVKTETERLSEETNSLWHYNWWKRLTLGNAIESHLVLHLRNTNCNNLTSKVNGLGSNWMQVLNYCFFCFVLFVLRRSPLWKGSHNVWYSLCLYTKQNFKGNRILL